MIPLFLTSFRHVFLVVLFLHLWMSEKFAKKNCEDTFDEGAKLSKPSYDPCGTSVSLSHSSQNKSNVKKVFQSSYRNMQYPLIIWLANYMANTKTHNHSITQLLLR